MPDLPRPFEALELPDGQSVTFRVKGYQLGTETIRPAHAPGGKEVRVLRVLVDPQDKASFPPYWDVTQTKLYAQLLPVVDRVQGTQRRVTITAYGFPPKKSFSVAVEGV